MAALLILAGISLLLALGPVGGIYPWLARLPGLSSFRAPARHLVLFHLALSGIAAVAFEDAPVLTYVQPAVAAAGTPVAAAQPPAAPPVSNEVEIKSPMIGTFYRAPSPESAPYIEIGSEVNPETVVCIIEAMKVMNEIKAEAKGVVTQSLVENAKPVEFGQPLFKIRST